MRVEVIRSAILWRSEWLKRYASYVLEHGKHQDLVVLQRSSLV